MFELPCCRRKNNPKETEEVTENRSRPRSVSSGRVTISGAPALKTSASNRSGRTRWLYRLFGRPVNKESPSEAVGQESGPCTNGACSFTVSNDPATNTTSGNLKPEKKSGRRSRVSERCRGKHQIAPAAERTPAPYQIDEVVEFTAPTDDEEEEEETALKEMKRVSQEKAQKEAQGGAHKVAKERAEKAAREEAERAAREEAERAAREEAKRAAREEAEKAAREEAERAAREEAERAAREKAEKAAREKATKKKAEKAAREEAEKAAREEAAQAEAEKAAREKAQAEVEKVQKEAQRETEKEDEKKKYEWLNASVGKPVYQAPAKKDSSSNSAKSHRVHHGDVTQIISSQSRGDQQGWLGFPNPAMICYMNSSLQSLITLGDFIRDIRGQEDVWSSVPEAGLIRTFMNVVRCHRSTDFWHKLQALSQFKRAVSLQAPEFWDNQQKDAQEFLTTVLDQIRSLSPLLEVFAASLGKIYRCPVEDHLVFRMQNTRTCKRCGAQSKREEDFTNLSLNLVSGGSVQDTLQDYLMETELDFRCDCGAKTSSQQSSFVTLPKVLMLHLKRFHFTPLLQLEKLSVPVTLFRELLVTSSQADGWYSLVSVISHLGSRGNAGHYVSDGVHPDVDLDDPFDSWLTYNDSEVTQTTGASVCEQRQESAYVLFYQRWM